MSESKILPCILAAGLSSRFQDAPGGTKMNLPFGDGTVLSETAKRVKNFCKEKPVLVIRQGVDTIELDTYPIQLNEYPENGQGGSLAIAAAYAKEQKAKSLLVFLGDMPLLKEGTVKRVLSACKEAPDNIIIPVFNGENGHPVCFPNSVFDELIQLRADGGGKSIIRKHPELVKCIELDQDIQQDLDTKEDYMNLIKR